MRKPTTETSSEYNPQGEEKRGRRAGGLTFPRNTLKKALEVAKAIEQDNAGDPYDPLLLATKSLYTTHKSSSFEILLVSSERYGLTKGNSRAKSVELTPLGSAIVAPTDESQTVANLRRALLTPKIFEQVCNKYENKNIPREDIVKNILVKEFNVPRTDADTCYDVIMQNISDYDLMLKSGENQILYLGNLGKATSIEQIPTQPELQPSAEDTQKPSEQIEKQIPKQIFVAHGKNKKPLEQLEKILDEYGLPYKVAIDEAHKGRPIGVKVAELMKSCTSGIFIFTGDEETQDSKGDSVLRPSDNVVYELGAASVLYGDKIVIFREEAVSFGSDFSELGYITFERDKLDAKGLDLLKELKALEFLKFALT